MDEKSKRDQEKKSKPKKSRLGPIISPDVIGIERNVETKDGTKKIVEKVPGKPEEPKPDDKVTEVSAGKTKDENSDSKKVDTGANKRLVSNLIPNKNSDFENFSFPFQNNACIRSNQISKHNPCFEVQVFSI